MRGIIIITFLCAVCLVRADQVLMQNGDRYNGKVVSVSTNAVVLQSEVMGTVTLPRAKVATLDLGAAQTNATPTRPQPIVMRGNATTNSASVDLSGLSTQTNLIQQVQSKILGDATPEANAQFNQMLNDLATGKMTMGDLRKQAADAEAELRDDIKEMGDDSGILTTYLSTLDEFLDQTGGRPTNAPPKAAEKSTAKPTDSLLDTY